MRMSPRMAGADGLRRPSTVSIVASCASAARLDRAAPHVVPIGASHRGLARASLVASLGAESDRSPARETDGGSARPRGRCRQGAGAQHGGAADRDLGRDRAQRTRADMSGAMSRRRDGSRTQSSLQVSGLRVSFEEPGEHRLVPLKGRAGRDSIRVFGCANAPTADPDRVQAGITIFGRFRIRRGVLYDSHLASPTASVLTSPSRSRWNWQGQGIWSLMSPAAAVPE
jgi:hypothetical protein